MVVYLSKNTKDYPPIYVVAQLIFFESGFVRALEILENPGKILKPWKPLEKPSNVFIKPWKISQNFIKKINS